MKARETATEIKFVHRVYGFKAPSFFGLGKYDEVLKAAKKSNTLIQRFPELWMAY